MPSVGEADSMLLSKRTILQQIGIWQRRSQGSGPACLAGLTERDS